MMNSSKYPMNSYVSTKPTVKFHYLQEMTFNEVINNLEKHFDNVYVTNFHYKFRGDPLQFSEKLIFVISRWSFFTLWSIKCSSKFRCLI